jgi:hypothetical protein
MRETLTLRIADIAGGGACVASEDGDRVHDAISEALQAGKRVQLSFAGVEDLTSAFLNAAVGQLYKGALPQETIREGLAPPVDASPGDLVLLKRVVERAKEFFRNPEPFEQTVRSCLGDEDE